MNASTIEEMVNFASVKATFRKFAKMVTFTPLFVVGVAFILSTPLVTGFVLSQIHANTKTSAEIQKEETPTFTILLVLAVS